MILTYTPVKIAKSITLLVTSDVESALRAQTAGWLLRREREAGQVVFVTWDGDEPRLETVGGALSVNGAMALTAWLALQNGVPLGETWSFPLPTAAAPLPCAVTPVNTCCLVTVTMPQPEIAALPGDPALPLVRFPGVSHIIAPPGAVQRTAAPELLRRWSAGQSAPAVGLLFWNEEARTLEPLIYDKAAGSALWHPGSGSAAAAVGAYLHGRAGQTVSVKEPGGVFAVTRTDPESLTVTVPAEVGRQRTADLVF